MTDNPTGRAYAPAGLSTPKQFKHPKTTRFYLHPAVNSIVQMSDASYTSLEKDGVDIASSASASFALASASVTGEFSTENAKKIQTAASQGTFTYNLAPAVKVPFAGEKGEEAVDCAEWAKVLEDAGAIHSPVGSLVCPCVFWVACA